MRAEAAELAANLDFGSGLSGFGSWMAAEQKRVYLLCLRILRNSDEADSATQDVFLKAYSALRQGRGKTIQDPVRWLTRIAVNTCLDVLRSRRWKFWRQRLPQEDERAVLLLSPAAGPSPEDSLFDRQIASRLTEALERLSLRQRAVFVLKHDEGKSLEEIAKLLELDLGTVKVHMARAVLKLRRELRDLYAR